MAGRAPLRKRVVQGWLTHYLLSHIAALYMRFAYLTSRIEYHTEPAALPYILGNKPAIFCFWHGRLIMQPFIKPKGREMKVMISQSNDGTLISTTMERFGIGAVRGSNKQGGAGAVRAMLTLAKRGDNLCITPDGPRGPFQVASPGAAFVAMKTGYSLVPLAFSARRHWRFRSWDRFMLPKPFTVIRFTVGEPLTVAPKSNQDVLDAVTEDLNQRLRLATAKADEACGVAA